MSDIPSPISATEKYLSKMAGSYSGDLPSPASRDEIFMYYAAINSGGGGEGTTDYTQLENKPSINGVTLTGDKTTSDLNLSTDLSNYYTKPQTDAKITEKVAEIVSDAPEDFDTLKEMSDWIASHEESAAAMNSAIQANATAIEGKVDKVAGKGLSTEDYTTAEKNKLAGIETGANKITVDSSLDSSSTNPVQNKTLYEKFLDVDSNISAISGMMDAILYGYRVNKNDSNPETRVEYMYDAVGMTPAQMNYTTGTFDYGSWGNAWFITENKPVALLYDGSIDYELDPDDYTKKADGTASDVSDSSYAGNFMASMPTVWIKRLEDDNYYYVAISNKQITPEFYADAHDAGGGTINPFIYLPMFKGAIIDGKMRSIAGVTPQGSTSGSVEETASEACGSGWQLWDWSKHELISDLLTLISRSTNSQNSFGQGDTNTYNALDTTTYGKLTTGTSGSGQFWGASDEVHHVKVFHIEDFWGNRWDRCLGLNLVDNQYVYKLVRPYVLDTDNTYTSSGLYAPAEGYQKSQTVGRFGTLPKTKDGSNSTYECDYFYKSTSGVRLGLFGGGCLYGAACGSRCVSLGSDSGGRGWGIGGSPCFNHPHEGV